MRMSPDHCSALPPSFYGVIKVILTLKSIHLFKHRLESLLLQLTSLVMEGRAGLKEFIDTVYTDILQVPGASRSSVTQSPSFTA